MNLRNLVIGFIIFVFLVIVTFYVFLGIAAWKAADKMEANGGPAKAMGRLIGEFQKGIKEGQTE